MVLSSIGDEYNLALRIICQKNKKGVKVSSTPNARCKVIDAANISKDSALNRLSISECSPFVCMSPMSAKKDTDYRRP